jgi:hypothetical protein
MYAATRVVGYLGAVVLSITYDMPVYSSAVASATIGLLQNYETAVSVFGVVRK